MKPDPPVWRRPDLPELGCRVVATLLQVEISEIRVHEADELNALVECFARTKAPAPLAEVADHLGWPCSSTFNLRAVELDVFAHTKFDFSGVAQMVGFGLGRSKMLCLSRGID